MLRPIAFRRSATLYAIVLFVSGIPIANTAEREPFAGEVSATATPALSPEPLTFEAALRAAEIRSLALSARDAAASAAREMAVTARQLPDPLLRLSVNNLPAEGSDRFSLTRDAMTMRSIGLMQTFTREDKRLARAARFEQEAKLAETERTMQLAILRRDTALAWLDRYYQQRIVELLKQQRDETVLQINAAEAAYRSGRGNQSEVFTARSAVAQIEDRIREAEAQMANSITMLARWVGEQASAPLGDAPSISRTRLETHLLEHQPERHPDIALMAQKEAVALAEVEMARQDKRADWNVEIMYSQRGPAYENMVSVDVSIPLQWDQKYRQDSEVAAKLALAESTRAEREEITREHLAQTRRRLDLWHRNLDRLNNYDKTLIPLVAERTHAALAAYRGSREPLSAVLEARRLEIDTRIERLRIEMETAGLWAQIEYLIPVDGDINLNTNGQ